MYKINYFGQEKLTTKYTLSDRLDYEHSSDHCLPLSPLKKKKSYRTSSTQGLISVKNCRLMGARERESTKSCVALRKCQDKKS